MPSFDDAPPERPRPPGPPPPRPAGLPEAPQHGDARATRARDEALTSFLDALRGPLTALVTTAEARLAGGPERGEHAALDVELMAADRAATAAIVRRSIIDQLDEEIRNGHVALNERLESGAGRETFVDPTVNEWRVRLDTLQSLRYRLIGSPLNLDEEEH